jgi:hypothetical protein
MKKVLNWLNAALNIAVWIIVIVLYELYNTAILLLEIVLSYLSKWIGWIIKGSTKFFRRSCKSLQKFILEIIHSIIHR